MGLINNNKLEWDINNNIVEIQSKDFITGNEYLELIQLRKNSISLHCNVGVVPFVILDASSACLSILVVVKHAVHVRPLLDCPFPML